MKYLRIALMIFVIFIFVYLLITIDYTNLSWTANRSSYIGIIASVLVAINLFLSYKKEQ